LARHWPRRARVLFRRQKAWFLPAAALVDWRGTGRAEPGYFSAGKKRGFCRLRHSLIGAALAAQSPGTFPPAKSAVFAGCGTR